MDIKEAVITCVQKKYADFSGRAGRPEFWWFALACLVAGIVTSFISDWLAMLVNLALLVPSLAVGARRLHDQDKSGWLQLIWLIPFVGWAVMIYFMVQPTGPANKYGDGPALPAVDVAPLPPGAV
jgi:uncharacterized membrane protein YhaH (DUF805 family)